MQGPSGVQNYSKKLEEIEKRAQEREERMATAAAKKKRQQMRQARCGYTPTTPRIKHAVILRCCCGARKEPARAPLL